jgi:aspartate carbamoyltransferase regulatory subunit
MGLPDHMELTNEQIDALSVIAADMLINFVPQQKVSTWIRDTLEVAVCWADW